MDRFFGLDAPAALDDLAKEGYFTRDVVAKRGCRGHYTIYIVN